MRIRPIHAYVALVLSSAVVAAVVQDWQTFGALSHDALLGLALLTAIGLISEGTALRLTLSRGKATSSVTFLPLLACVLLFGPPAAVVFYFVNGAIAEFLIRKKDIIRAAFNVGQYVLSTAIAGWVFLSVGGEPIAVSALDAGSGGFDLQLGAFAAFAATFLVTNNVLVFLAISLSSPDDFKHVFGSLVHRQAWSFTSDLMISPLGLVIAALYLQIGHLGIIISLLPIVFVRYSYLSKFQLEQVNQDLLKALVMAIETRDEYTSGHSLRVQKLSERLGRMLGLSVRRLGSLSTAALLHDIGKIEVVYEEILQKPGKLTRAEVRLMQSHVERGVEILTSLSSSKQDVIDAVRYHHEAWDGSGYPHGKAGEEIPLTARIIGVSDAIDAMLSDRPYRKALGPDAVKEQLQTYRGRQFDPKIADLVINSSVIEDHVAEIKLSEGLRTRDLRKAFRAGVASSPQDRIRGAI